MKGAPAVPRGPLTSKPTWSNTSECLTTSVKALEIQRLHEAMKWEYLQGDATAEGLLLRFVDHAHAVPANFAQNVIIAQIFRYGSR